MGNLKEKKYVIVKSTVLKNLLCIHDGKNSVDLAAILIAGDKYLNALLICIFSTRARNTLLIKREEEKKKINKKYRRLTEKHGTQR